MPPDRRYRWCFCGAVLPGWLLVAQWPDKVLLRQHLGILYLRARGLSERKDPEVAWFGSRVMAELQRLVH